MLKRLIYGSDVVPSLVAADLEALLAAAREANARLGITGFLVFDGAKFMQLLEGPPVVVDDLFARIRRDRRHVAVQPLLIETAATRAFSAWSMAYVTLEPGCLQKFGGSMTAAHARELAMLLRGRPSPVVTALAEALLAVFDSADLV